MSNSAFHEKVGVVTRVYNLHAQGWHEVVWGDPVNGKLGVAPTLARLLLEIPAGTEVVPRIYEGPTVSAEGTGEGQYTRNLMLRRLGSSGIGEYAEFSRIYQRLERLPEGSEALLRSRIESIQVGDRISNTQTETEAIGRDFAAMGVTRVKEVAIPTHAPRCVRDQAVLKDQRRVSPDLLWETAFSDVPFPGTSPVDVIIIEPAHKPESPETRIARILGQTAGQLLGENPDHGQTMADILGNMAEQYRNQ